MLEFQALLQSGLIVTRREESWEEIRPEIFKEVVSLKGYPASKVHMHVL